MMKRLISSLMALAVVAVASGVTQAAIEASSYLNIIDYRVINTATSAPVTAGVGGEVAITGTTSSIVMVASMNGVDGIGTGLSPSLNADAAFSDGVTGYGSPLLGYALAPAGVQDNFSPRPLAVALPYARADSDGSGTIVTILPGAPTSGADVQSIADVVVPNTATIDNQGFSSASLTSSSTFFRVTSPLSVVLSFDALLDLTLDYSLPPAGLALAASASFETLLTGTGITVGGATSGSFTFAPTELNTGLITRTTAGLTGGHPGVLYTFTTPVITLAPGTYSLTITQGNTASITNVVPEPAAALTWGALLAVSSVIAAKRCRRNKS